MSDDCLKLTAYFGERKRTDSGLVAAQLLDLFGRAGLATSILLRGTEGFGVKHQLRTDSTLSRSEDLPAVAVAVDTRDRIEAVFDETRAVVGSGLVTLERARLVTDDVEAAEPNGPTKLTVYLGRQVRAGGVPAYAAVCELLRQSGIAGATTLLGVDGTVHGRRERAGFFNRNRDVPVMVIAVGSGDGMARVLPRLGALVDRPLITLEGVRVCKRDGRTLTSPHDPAAAVEGARQKLMIYSSESQLYDGRPIHRMLMRRLRAAGASGATTVCGIWGFSGDQPPYGDRTFQLGRRVPTVTTVIDAPDRIAGAFAIVDELTLEHGLVTSETGVMVR